jgi:hypothetical protein
MSPDDLDMHVIYDVSHNIAKVEEHVVDGKVKTLLLHRKVINFIFWHLEHTKNRYQKNVLILRIITYLIEMFYCIRVQQGHSHLIILSSQWTIS